MTSAKYLSSGPLTQLVLANGLTEQHLFDARYYPKTVSVTGSTSLTWSYAVDNVGNITQINNGTNPRTYSYFDNLYFLKQGDGPWGTRSWTYDRIGNRLSETRGATTDTYNYTSHNPRLGSITLGGSNAGTRAYTYDPAGNVQLLGLAGHCTGQLKYGYSFSTYPWMSKTKVKKANGFGRFELTAKENGRVVGRAFLPALTPDQLSGATPIHVRIEITRAGKRR